MLIRRGSFPRGRHLIPAVVASLLLSYSATAMAQDTSRHATFLRLLDSSTLTLDQTAAGLMDAFRADGIRLAADVPLALDSGFCSFGARVLVFHDDAYAARVLSRGEYAAYAVPLRIAVFEDENGVHAATVNPMSLNRTMVQEKGADPEWSDLAARLQAVVADRFPNEAVNEEFGQWRKEGRIGRTMGIMAGGAFPDKVQTLVTVSAAGTSVGDVATRIMDGMGAVPGEWEWGMRPVYRIDLPEAGMTVLGATGGHMATRAFGIVKHGNQKDREKLACPGIDHAAAFPIEMVVHQVGDEIRVESVDPMFRMKMYFEDAGKMSFAKNMGMPGSIKDEMRKKVEASLGLEAS